MKVVYNRWIPVRGFMAINLVGFIFIRKDLPREYLEESPTRDILLRHERIHMQQMVERLIIPFYLIYIIEWLVRLLACGDSYRAYRRISFEQEAYDHQDDVMYNQRRQLFAFCKYYRRRYSRER